MSGIPKNDHLQKNPSFNTFEALSTEISSSSFSGLLSVFTDSKKICNFFNEFEDLLS